jgi:hypothetical protein
MSLIFSFKNATMVVLAVGCGDENRHNFFLYVE